MKIKLRKFIVIIIIFSAFGGNLGRYLHRAPKRHYCDFRVYHDTAQRFLKKENIYSRPDEKITPFKYSPLFAFLISPLGLLSRKAASIIFFTLNFFSLIGALMLSKRLITKHTALAYYQSVCLYTLTTIFSFRFILQVIDSGQISIIMFFLILTALYFINKKMEIRASVLLSLPILFKYTPSLFIPYFLFRKKYKIFIFVIVSIILLLLLPSIYLGLEKNINLLKQWIPYITKTSLDKWSWYDYKNQSFNSLILRYTTKDTPFKEISLNLFTFNQGLLFSYLLGLILYISILIRGKSTFETECDTGMLFICMALFNPNAWLTNFIFLTFGYMFLIYYLIIHQFKDKMTAVLLTLSFILCSWASESVVGNNIENLFEKLSSVTIGTLLLYISLLKIKFFPLKE